MKIILKGLLSCLCILLFLFFSFSSLAEIKQKQDSFKKVRVFKISEMYDKTYGDIRRQLGKPSDKYILKTCPDTAPVNIAIWDGNNGDDEFTVSYHNSTSSGLKSDDIIVGYSYAFYGDKRPLFSNTLEEVINQLGISDNDKLVKTFQTPKGCNVCVRIYRPSKDAIIITSNVDKLIIEQDGRCDLKKSKVFTVSVKFLNYPYGCKFTLNKVTLKIK